VTARAVILAAGRGTRLGGHPEATVPKCLLRFGGTTLLERHLRLLRTVGVTDVVLVVGHLASSVAAELAALRWEPAPAVIVNPDYQLGSTVSLHAAGPLLTPGGDDLLVMDADVLYDQRMLTALISGDSTDRMLADYGFVFGQEPVKICESGGRIVDLTKDIPGALVWDRLAESVGFFRLSPPSAIELASVAARFVEAGRTDLPHEEVLRELVRSGRATFEAADVTTLPWCEIDFPHDITHARGHVLPRLEGLRG
jgi:choline kinase